MYLTKYLQGVFQIGCLSLYVKEGNHLSIIASTVYGSFRILSQFISGSRRTNI